MPTVNDVLAEATDLPGARVLDIGCGAGDLVRWLQAQGVRPTGAECGAEMRARALAADPDHHDDYVDAVGQDLPFDDASFDIVVFASSLHHVPIADMPAALAEARRVLRHGGTLFVGEPAIEGPEQNALHPIVDETVERAAAQAAIDAAIGFAERRHFEFEREVIIADFDAHMALITDMAPDRAQRLEANRTEVRANFERIGVRRDEGWAFRRRTVVTVLTAD